jgi:hypothetical protein
MLFSPDGIRRRGLGNADRAKQDALRGNARASPWQRLMPKRFKISGKLAKAFEMT